MQNSMALTFTMESAIWPMAIVPLRVLLTALPQELASEKLLKEPQTIGEMFG